MAKAPGKVKRATLADTVRRSPRIGFIVWLFVLPVALAVLGLWQLQRGGETLEGSARSVTHFNEMLDQLHQITADDPEARVSFGDDEATATSYTASEAASQVQDALGTTNTDLLVSRIRYPLAWGTLGGAALSLIGAIVGLLASGVAGFRARRSRDQLIRSFRRLRAILPAIMAITILGFSVAVVCGTLFEAIGLWFWDELSTNSLKLAAAALILAALAAYGAFTAIVGLRQVFAAFTPEPRDVFGREVSEAEAPVLWEFVRELATRQETILPDTIISGLGDGFYVTEGAIRLMPEQRVLQGRTLFLPAPYLELLDTAEISAIIGHELAHFSGEDTRYSTQFAPIYASLVRALRALRVDHIGGLVLQPASRLGFHAIGQFDTAVAHWSRLREFEADRRGSLVSGPAGAASALIRSSIAAPAVDFALGRAFEEPSQADENLVGSVASLVVQKGLADPAVHLKDQQPHPTDSHPPTGQRLEALGVKLPAILQQATRPHDTATPSFGQRAFADWDGFGRTLSRDFLNEAETAHVQRRNALQSAVSAVSEEEIILYENTKPMILTMIVAIVIFAAAGVSVFEWAAQIGFGHDDFAQMLVGGVCALCILAFGLYAILLRRRTGQPLMTLTPDHLTCSRFRLPIPWTDVATYGVYATQRFALRLTMNDDAPLPERQGFWIYTKVNRRHRTVTIDCLGVRGQKPTDFSGLVGRYLQAAYARRELAEKAS